MAWRILKWGSPDGNGWNDWPAGLIERMSAVINVYDSMYAYTTSRGDKSQWADRNPAAFRNVSKILKMDLGLDE